MKATKVGGFFNFFFFFFWKGELNVKKKNSAASLEAELRGLETMEMQVSRSIKAMKARKVKTRSFILLQAKEMERQNDAHLFINAETTRFRAYIPRTDI